MTSSEDYDWQLAQDTVVQRDTFILDNEEWTDCTFIVGEDECKQTFKCHRLYLAKTSAVFAAMLYGGLQDKNAEYRVTDVDPEVFGLMLRYIYTGCIDIKNFVSACGLLYFAKKYLMPTSLRLQCKEYLEKNITVKNAMFAFEFASTNDEPDIKKQAVEIIEFHAEEIFQDAGILDISQETLISIIKNDSLNISSETKVYDICFRWAKNELNNTTDESVTLRQLFSPFLPYIRFLSLSNKSFWELYDMENILSADENLSLLKCINRTNAQPPDGFCTKKEQRKFTINVATLEEDGKSFLVQETSSVEPTDKNWKHCCFNSLTHFKLKADDIALKGIVISSQLHPTTYQRQPIVNASHYKEKLTVFVYDTDREKIINRITFSEKVLYESKIEIEVILDFDKIKYVEFVVQFHKTGRYPFNSILLSDSNKQSNIEVGIFKNQSHVLIQSKLLGCIQALACKEEAPL